MHGDKSSIANCRKKNPVIFRGMFVGIFCGILKCIYIYFAISHGTPNDVLLNRRVLHSPAWEALT
jgi:hypothetical protein